MQRQMRSLDVHFEIRPDMSKEWTRCSFHGLKCAIERADFPIQVYLVRGLPGIAGSVCGGGYTCGTSLYATHTAVEEYILPNAFVEVGRVLFPQESKCSLSELSIDAGKLVRNLKQNLVVVRRDLLLDRHHVYSVPYYKNHVARAHAATRLSHQS